MWYSEAVTTTRSIIFVGVDEKLVNLFWNATYSSGFKFFKLVLFYNYGKKGWWGCIARPTALFSLILASDDVIGLDLKLAVTLFSLGKKNFIAHSSLLSISRTLWDVRSFGCRSRWPSEPRRNSSLAEAYQSRTDKNWAGLHLPGNGCEQWVLQLT